MILEVALALLGSNLLKNEKGRTFAGPITKIGTMAQVDSARREMNTTVTRAHVSIAREQTIIPKTTRLVSIVWNPVISEGTAGPKEMILQIRKVYAHGSPRRQIQTLSSVVDHGSVFLKMTVFGDETIEAVCECGASLSCLSSKVFDKLQKLGVNWNFWRRKPNSWLQRSCQLLQEKQFAYRSQSVINTTNTNFTCSSIQKQIVLWD